LSFHSVNSFLLQGFDRIYCLSICINIVDCEKLSLNEIVHKTLK
jgi:hypothetical protein